MAWRAPFPRSRLPASVEFINKASMCVANACTSVCNKQDTTVASMLHLELTSRISTPLDIQIYLNISKDILSPRYLI
jgi:hypothetical protein